MKKAVALLTDQPFRQIGLWLRTTEQMRQLPVADRNTDTVPALWACIVHSIKGATRDSVRLIIEGGRGRRTPPAQLLGNALNGACITWPVTADSLADALRDGWA